ncbi:calcium-transporting ATPase 12, plasma membrane-type-like [Magnolia sinica]|uniref:calcium-transporting ATPase 12, plasma membrane-type-like n=1 Tax=Magnolia sinica TaxID=86752 RepID=UPI002657EC9B|nr:calcium-transporting ATPase 12, plasma membrane-type-like [Magnolia sinica]
MSSATDYSKLLLNGRKSSHKRWRTAFAVIYSFRAMLSLANDILSKKKSINSHLLSKFSSNQPHVTIDVDVDDSSNLCFSVVDQESLTKIVKGKDLDSLSFLGGVEGIMGSLESDAEKGIRGNDEHIRRRRDVFGSNTYLKQPLKGFFSFVLEAFKDHVILILLGCAGLSLVFGIKEHGLKEGWYDGGSIFIAIFLVVVVSAISNFRQARQFDKLSDKSNDIVIDVMRDGRRQKISIFEVVVGDVVCLKIGDQIPADGLFLNGHSLQLDESSMTGESDHVNVDKIKNPFLFSGTKVVDGYAHMLVTSVGKNTTWGEMMNSISLDMNEETPLQARLNKLTSYIGKIGLSVAVLVLIVLLVRYFTGNTTDEDGHREFNRGKTKIGEVMNSVANIFAAAVTIVVVAIPEGLPLAVTLTLAYSMKRMMADQAMVRKLSACETMGSVNTICTDKTGTLTMNQMKVDRFWLDEESLLDSSKIATNVVELLHQGVGLNTTGSVYTSTMVSEPEFSGSPTEKAILSWAVLDLGMNMDGLKRSWTILHVEAFNSEKKQSGILVRKNDEKSIHVHRKGAAEMILAMCSNYFDSNGTINAIDEQKRMKLEQIIEAMAAQSLRCIAFAHKQIAEDIVTNGNDGVQIEKLSEDGLTLLGMVGLKDPCRPGVRMAVEACRKAGVAVKMITGDNVFTARAIAVECGILGPDQDMNGAVLEGKDFRSYSTEQRMEMVNRICVMARSSPFDKLLMVQTLKQKGQVVAVTGDGTNDAPALKESDIGLSMGIQGTEVAKESSDIVILDDNFTSIVTVLQWGRCVYNNIQKFIQFQLSVNVAALLINFIAAISSGDVPLTAVQLLWVNLIMDTLGALALATERPAKELMDQKPVGRTEPLITNIMWRNLIAQALYQITVLLILQFKGKSIFGVDERVRNTLIFNTFVLCQVFNELNARKLEKKNVFEGIHRNRLFIGIVGFTIILQVVMVEFLNRFADTERLNWGQWGVCVGIAAVSWPIGWLGKCIPVSDKPLFSYLKQLVFFKF